MPALNIASQNIETRPILRTMPSRISRDVFKGKQKTSGYIIETLYDIGRIFDDKDANIRAEKIGHWLVSVQNPDGSFANDNYAKDEGIVFDTGQVLFGLARCFKETGF